jgi:uncharacterized protein
MKIALFGATGTIGSRIAKEATSRGHSITAISRKGAVRADAANADEVANAVRGHDAVVNATGPGRDEPTATLGAVARGLIDGLRKAGVKRLLTVGGAGSLEVAPGKRLVDTPQFPAAWKPVALAHAATLDDYRKSELDWTYLSPAAMIAPGERTGKYRTGLDKLLVDTKGESRISAEDFAIAVVDELEKNQNLRRRFTVGK